MLIHLAALAVILHVLAQWAVYFHAQWKLRRATKQTAEAFMRAVERYGHPLEDVGEEPQQVNKEAN